MFVDVPLLKKPRALIQNSFRFKIGGQKHLPCLSLQVIINFIYGTSSAVKTQSRDLDIYEKRFSR